MGRITLVLVAAALLHAAPSRADLRDDDDELRQHLLSTDPILSRADCRGGSIERESDDEAARFTLLTTCPAPPPEDDCPAYRVTARGTIDTATQATIRDLRMELVCTDDPGVFALSFAGSLLSMPIITAGRHAQQFAQQSNRVLAFHRFNPGIPLSGVSERMPSDFFRTTSLSRIRITSLRKR